MTRQKRNLAFLIQICVEKDGEGYYAYCPALKGVRIDGETAEQAVENVKIAAALYIKSLIKHGDPIPIQIVIHSPEAEKNTQSPPSSKMSLCSLPITEQVLVPV